MDRGNPLPKQYFEWLYRQVIRISESRPVDYFLVCEMMHDMDFKVLVPRDDNRVADGAQLRNEFARSTGGEPLDEAELMYPDASIFEVLVALAIKAEKMIEIPQRAMFMIFLENLGLDRYHDESDLVGLRIYVNRILRRFNNRTYTSKGHGGLFPMKRPLADQRKIELWYQMGAYMSEREMY